MADIFEVLEGLIKAYNIEMHEVFDIKEEKARERGAFNERIILERVWEEWWDGNEGI